VNDAADPHRPEEANLTEGPPLHLRSANVCCANFCRVTGSAEEFILDFAMDCELGPQQTHRPMAAHRITLSPSTAKRLIAALNSLLAQYESRFGPIEINVERRLVEAQLPNLLQRD